MTLQCVIRYAGKDGLAEGYVIGTDSAGRAGKRRFNTNKIILGRTTVGICTGRFALPTGWRIAKCLDGLFDDIEAGKPYNDIPALAHSRDYAIMVAEQGPPVSLYVVSSKGHRACLVDRINCQETAKILYKGSCGKYKSIRLGRSISRHEAIRLMPQILAGAGPRGYKPGIISVIKINMRGISILQPIIAEDIA